MVRQDRKRSCWTSPKGHHKISSGVDTGAGQALSQNRRNEPALVKREIRKLAESKKKKQTSVNSAYSLHRISRVDNLQPHPPIEANLALGAYPNAPMPGSFCECANGVWTSRLRLCPFGVQARAHLNDEPSQGLERSDVKLRSVGDAGKARIAEDQLDCD